MSRYEIALGKVSNEPPPKQETRVFEQNGKINFVDTNNVFVGYDMEQDCCETADWFISGKIEESLPEDPQKTDNLNGYVFDTAFFKKVSWYDFDEDEGEGKRVIFKLINIHQEKYLHLYNCHNGYYGHGFEMKINDEVIKSDLI